MRINADPTRMSIRKVAAIISLAAAASWLARPCKAAPAEPSPTSCAHLHSLSPIHAQIMFASMANADGGQACKVDLISKTTPDSAIRFEVWLPIGAVWNGRLVQVGNAGLPVRSYRDR